ncbi:hypothetical protein DXG01_000660 [Tephrocybe rancida]|nr:hypothetical protein DXG01_000660 [Tephrocybe rancida]
MSGSHIASLNEAERDMAEYIKDSAIVEHPAGVGGAFGEPTTVLKIARADNDDLTWEKRDNDEEALISALPFPKRAPPTSLPLNTLAGPSVASTVSPVVLSVSADEVSSNSAASIPADFCITTNEASISPNYEEQEDDDDEQEEEEGEGYATELAYATVTLTAIPIIVDDTSIASPHYDEEEESDISPSDRRCKYEEEESSAPSNLSSMSCLGVTSIAALAAPTTVPLSVTAATHYTFETPPLAVLLANTSRATPISGLNLDPSLGLIAQLVGILADPDFHRPDSATNLEFLDRMRPSRVSPDHGILRTVGRPTNSAMGLNCRLTGLPHPTSMHRVLPSQLHDFSPNDEEKAAEIGQRYLSDHYSGSEDYSDTPTDTNRLLALHHPIFSPNNESVLASAFHRAHFWKTMHTKALEEIGRLTLTGPEGLGPPLHEELVWMQAAYEVAPDLVILENSGRVPAAAMQSTTKERRIVDRPFPKELETTVDLRLSDLPPATRVNYEDRAQGATHNRHTTQIVKQVSLGDSNEPAPMVMLSALGYVDDIRRNAVAASLEIANSVLSSEENAEHKAAWDRGHYHEVIESPSTLRENIDGKVVPHPLAGLLTYTIYRSIGLEGNIGMKGSNGSQVDASVLNSTYPVIGLPGVLHPSLPPNLSLNILSLTLAVGLLQHGGDKPADPVDVRLGRHNLKPIFKWSDAAARKLWSLLAVPANNNEPGAMRRLKIWEEVILAHPHTMEDGATSVAASNGQTPWAWMTVPLGAGLALVHGFREGRSEWHELKSLLMELELRANDPTQADTIAGSILGKNAPTWLSPCYLVLRSFMDLVPEKYQEEALRTLPSPNMPHDFL